MLPFSEDNNDLLVLKQQAVSTKSSCDIIFMKIKVIWFYIQKTISGSYLQQNNIDLVFQTLTIFWKFVSS